MKDILGVEVEEGDVILACAASRSGLAKLGRVYGLNKNGIPMIAYVGKRWNGREYAESWRKGEAGLHVLVIGRESLGEMAPTAEVLNAITREYPE